MIESVRGTSICRRCPVFKAIELAYGYSATPGGLGHF